MVTLGLAELLLGDGGCLVFLLAVFAAFKAALYGLVERDGALCLLALDVDDAVVV